MLHRLLRIARSLAFAWVALVILVAVLQQSLIYFPTHATEEAVVVEAQQHGLEAWRTARGETIGWRRPGREGRAANRLLVFHGNAGYALNRWYYVTGFGALHGGRTWDVHLFEYPGYGARPGKRGEASFKTAAAEALATLRAEDSRPIFVLGESIGSGPACALLAAHPQQIAGACLVTPFARLGDVAAHHYPFLPIRLILRDRWDNVAALANYPGRIAARIAGQDEIVTAAQGQLLLDGFHGPKRIWIDPQASHNEIIVAPDSPWWREVSDFLLTP